MDNTSKSNTVHYLICTLTKAEKRYFQLYSSLQEGNKAYLFLFEQFGKGHFPGEVYTAFTRQFPDKNYSSAIKHLYKVLMDCLLKLRENTDIQTRITNHISKAAILFERELPDEAFAELNRARRLATDFENDPLLLLISRTELKYHSALDFKGISEQELVNKQMKISEINKYSRNLNQHIQLYDILKYRLTYKGYARSDCQKQDLNDLVLSELHLIANSSYKGFEAQKLHLLFQATYYLNSGNYKSAIRFYKELITLFEDNPHLILNPPIYYLSAIEGILHTLHTAGLYTDMPFFINKLKKIETGSYSSDFKLLISSTIYHYEPEESNRTSHYNKLIHKSNSLPPDKQLRLYLSEVATGLYHNNLNLARQNMKKILSQGKLFHRFPLYRTTRLMNLLLQTELANYDFIPNEITSLRRSLRSEKPIYHTENLIFWYVQSCPLPQIKHIREKLYRTFLQKNQQIQSNKYERHLLKTFNFPHWIGLRLSLQ